MKVNNSKTLPTNWTLKTTNPDERDKCLVRKISLKKQEIFLQGTKNQQH